VIPTPSTQIVSSGNGYPSTQGVRLTNDDGNRMSEVALVDAAVSGSRGVGSVSGTDFLLEHSLGRQT